MKYRIVIAGVLILLAGCKDGKKFLTSTDSGGIETTVIDFEVLKEGHDSVAFQELLPFSELSDDIQVVKLETGENCLIAGNARYKFTDSCILVAQRDQIMLFARDGRFLRTIVREGRGPQEYDSFSDIVVDEPTGRIYLLEEFGQVKIYSLRDSAYFANFRLTDDRFYNSILLTGSNRILVAPYYFEKTKNLICEVDSTGKLLNAVPAPYNNKRGLIYDSYLLLSEVGDEYHYASSLRDTIYQFIGGALKPRWIFRVGGNQEMEINGETRNELFITVKTILKKETVENGDGGIYTSTEFSSETYRYDKENRKVKRYGRVWDDHFASAYRSVNDLQFQEGKWFYWSYSASELAEIIEAVQKDGEVKQEIKDNLKEFSKTLSPEDNPVLVVGRLK